MSEPVDIAAAPEGEKAPSFEALGSSTLHEFIRYFAASFVALAVDIGVLWLLTSIFGVEYLLSAAVSFLLGLTIVYLASIYWIFETRNMRSPGVEFGIFLIIGLIGLGINEGVLWLLTGGLGLYYLVSKIASVFIVFSWNFLARKYFLFKTS